MTRIHTYLTFNGNCREAMSFYRECIGGELSLQTIGDSPMADQLPQPMKNSILHATLTKDAFVLMGSDMASEDGLIHGNAVSLMLDCASENDIRLFYEKLSDNGKKDHPLEQTFWGALFGDVTDKFGNHWLLHYQK